MRERARARSRAARAPAARETPPRGCARRCAGARGRSCRTSSPSSVPQRAHERVRHDAHDRDQRTDDRVLEPVLHRIVGRRELGRESAFGDRRRVEQPVAERVRRLDADDRAAPTAIGRSPRSHAASRTASFSVVSTIAAAALARPRRCARRRARRSGGDRGTSCVADDLPAGRRDVGEEALGPRDAGHDEHARARRHDDRLARARDHARRADARA